jgi:hypothetical protein
MKHGDISNELPKRLLVTTDIFLTLEIKKGKKLKIIPTVKIDKKIDRAILSWLYLYTNRTGFTLELVSYDLTEQDLSTLVDQLDKAGTNPFRYFTAYDAVNHLVSELPLRPEVVGVVDIQSRLLRYGHWGRDFKGL